MAKSKTVGGPDTPAVAATVVPVVSAGRVGVEESLTGKDRRRAEKAATAPVKPKKVTSLHKQLDALVETAAELGLHLEVDRDALAALTAEQPTAETTGHPAPPPPPPPPPAPAPAGKAGPRAAKKATTRPAPRTGTPTPVRRATRVTPEPAPAAKAPRRRVPAGRTTPAGTSARRTTPTRTPARRSEEAGPA